MQAILDQIADWLKGMLVDFTGQTISMTAEDILRVRETKTSNTK